MILHLSAFKSLSLVPIYFVVFVKMKREDFQALIEQEIFEGRPYGFARLKSPHISEAIVAEIETCLKDIEVSEIQRRVTPDRKERYFP